MTKKEQIIILIESDILSSKLIITLTNIGIDAGNYVTDISRVVFAMIGIEETEELLENYFTIINQVEHFDILQADEKNRLAIKCYNFLISKT